MRNALFFDVTESGTVLRVRTSLAGNLKCQGFRITDAAAQFTTNDDACRRPTRRGRTWQTGHHEAGLDSVLRTNDRELA